MSMIACDWELDVERGPNWLLVKIGTPPDEPWETPPLADTLRSLMEEHFTYRLVLEMDQIDLSSNALIRQLLALDKWIRAHGGVMRLCGLSPCNAGVLQLCGLDSYFPAYRDRLEAVLGCQRPSQPR